MKQKSQFITIHIAGLPGEPCGHQTPRTIEDTAAVINWRDQESKEGFLRNAGKMKKGDFYQATSSVTILCTYDGSPRKHDPEVLQLLDDLKKALDDYDRDGILSGTDHHREMIANAREKFAGARKRVKVEDRGRCPPTVRGCRKRLARRAGRRAGTPAPWAGSSSNWLKFCIAACYKIPEAPHPNATATSEGSRQVNLKKSGRLQFGHQCAGPPSPAIDREVAGGFRSAAVSEFCHSGKLRPAAPLRSCRSSLSKIRAADFLRFRQGSVASYKNVSMQPAHDFFEKKPGKFVFTHRHRCDRTATPWIRSALTKSAGLAVSIDARK